jgi:hypothetical protein
MGAGSVGAAAAVVDASAGVLSAAFAGTANPTALKPTVRTGARISESSALRDRLEVGREARI